MLGTRPISTLLSRVEIPALIERDTPADGNVTPYELEVIASLVRATAPQELFEIGTFDGRTSLNMAANAPAGATVYTLDLPAMAWAPRHSRSNGMRTYSSRRSDPGPASRI